MAEAPNVPGKWGRFCKEPLPDAVIGELADRQHGVVALWQLRALGLSDSAVHKRASAWRLHRVHRGVYAVGRRGLTERGHWMAAVLACGPDAVLSHRAAAALLGLRPDNRSRIDVSVPRRAARSRAGIEVHVSETLRARDLTSWDGIPCTSVARTLLDLGDVVRRRDLERAVEQAEVLRVFDLRAVEDVLARAGPRRGAGLLRAVIDDSAEQGLTESELEEAFLELCRGAALPQPAVNAWIALEDGMVKADFLWRAERLVVETDGHAFHGTREAFERDRRRDQLLTLAGFKIVRFTWRQVTIEPDAVAETIGALL
jgi:very-short-patch-repair endonuclease